MTFEGDAFISYAHIDNVGLVEGQKGWVANLHRVLEVKVAQRLGRPSKIWRDPKLAGNDVLTDALAEQLRTSMALVSVLSPGYIRSEWCRKELEEFCKAVHDQGVVAPVDKARIFKVLKTPVPLHQLPEQLQSLLGYEFFKVDPETGRVRELDEIFGDDAERDFFLKLDDLVHDLCELIEEGSGSGSGAEAPAPAKGTVFLAETTSDLRDERDAIRRDLQQHGYLVLPARALSLLSAPEVASAIRDDLSRCRLSVHLIGRNFSLVPEGGVESLQEVQNDVAIERGHQPGLFSRLVWIPRNLKVADDRQQQVLERLRMDQRLQDNSDLLETSFEDLRTAIFSALEGKPKPPPPRVSTSIQIYLLYDSRDVDAAAPWADFLFKDFEVIQPVFTGDEADLRQYHEENLRSCDGVLILYGAGNEPWLRRKLAELQKSAGYGRTKAMPEVAICLIPPQTPEKARFRTHRALVIPQWDGLSPEPLRPFVDALKTKGEEPQRDGAGNRV
jgi:hypothetical protein